MTSKELFKKWKKYIIFSCICDKNIINELEQIERDLDVLEILKSNIIDYFVEYGSDHEEYNIATITIQVKQLKEYTEKMIGKEIHYTPCKIINDNDFELLIDMLVKEREKIINFINKKD